MRTRRGCGKSASASDKEEVLDPAAGELVTLGDAPGPFVGKTVLIDTSGWAHVGSKRGSKQVSRRRAVGVTRGPRRLEAHRSNAT